ncbi:MAG: hypothetical protein VW518_01950 [Burkholderiaceae bacterium]
METVDSKETLLDGPTIVARHVRNTLKRYPQGVSMAAMAVEFTRPDIDVVQIGNTVFIGHLGKGKNAKKMVGRALNVDTGKNFMTNGAKYFTYLQKRGITHYSTMFESPIFLNIFRLLQRQAHKGDTQVGIGRLKRSPNTYVAFVRLGKEPLKLEA